MAFQQLKQTTLLVIAHMFYMTVCIAAKQKDNDTSRSGIGIHSQGSGILCQGLPGLPGRDGRDGRDATLMGPPGKPGPAGIQGKKGDAGSVTGGAVYTRWGRNDCPKSGNINELYSGVMGGSLHEDRGGGSNYLCLPLNPVFDSVSQGRQDNGRMCGVEYMTSGQSNIFSRSVHHHNVPCAVCHTESRGSHVMIPARNVCPVGWTLEYKGYIMSAHRGHRGRTQFICVDKDPGSTVGGHHYQGTTSAYLYFAEAYCGSLSCGPYIQGYELTCAVCTK